MRITIKLDDDLLAAGARLTGITGRAPLISECFKALAAFESAGQLALLGVAFDALTDWPAKHSDTIYLVADYAHGTRARGQFYLSFQASPAPKLSAHLRSPHLRGVHRLDEQGLHLAAFHRRDGRIGGAAF